MTEQPKPKPNYLYPGYDEPGVVLPDCRHLDLDENGTCRSCGRYNYYENGKGKEKK